MVLIDSRPTERNPVGSIVRTRGGVLLTAAPTDRFDSPLAGLTREQRACVVPGDRVVILCRYAPEPTHAEA